MPVQAMKCHFGRVFSRYESGDFDDENMDDLVSLSSLSIGSHSSESSTESSSWDYSPSNGIHAAEHEEEKPKRHGHGFGNQYVVLSTMALALASVTLFYYASVPRSKTVVAHELVGLPSNYQHFLDSSETNKTGAIAVVWDIPGDGDVLQHTLSRCMGLVAAGGALGDRRQTHATGDEPLVTFQNNHGTFVNCFAGSQKGIDRMIRMNLTKSHIADVIYAPMIYEVGPAFTEHHPAMMVAMFHDPIQRIASIYHVATRTVPAFKNATIAEFLDTLAGANNNNWMTRELSNCGLDEANEECLRVAKEIVTKKCIVGLASDVEMSLERIYSRMGWSADASSFTECTTNLGYEEGFDTLYTDLVAPGSADYELIASRNALDIELYKTAKDIYARQ